MKSLAGTPTLLGLERSGGLKKVSLYERFSENFHKSCVNGIMLSYVCQLETSSLEEKERLISTLKSEKNAFNLACIIAVGLKNVKKKLSIIDLHREFYRKGREKFPELPSQYLIRAEQSAKSALKSIKSNKHKNAKTPEKTKLSVQLDKRIYSIKGESIFITAIGGKRVECKIKFYPKLTEMFQRYEMRDPLIFSRDGKLFLSIPFRPPQLTPIENTAIGIDLGMRFMAVTSEGKGIKGTEFNKNKRRIRHNKRQLQSKGTKSARRHLKKLRKKEANYSKNYIHHVANELLKTDSNTIILEDLAKLKKKKHKKQNKNRISQIPFYLLRHTIEYKAGLVGKQVVMVSPFNTSKDDYRGIKSGDRKGRRYYTVDGLIFDADLQAAITIATRYGKPPISFVSPFDGVLKPTGQALVNEPIVFKSSGKLEVLQATTL